MILGALEDHPIIEVIADNEAPPPMDLGVCGAAAAIQSDCRVLLLVVTHDGLNSPDHLTELIKLARIDAVERLIRRDYSVTSVADIHRIESPVVVEFTGQAGRLILRESYKGEDGECVFVLVGIQKRVGVILLGSGENVIGASSSRPRFVNPRFDPVGALLHLLETDAGATRSGYYSRVGIASRRTGVDGLAQCALYRFAAVLCESERRCFPVTARSLAIFAAHVSVKQLVDASIFFEQAGMRFPAKTNIAPPCGSSPTN